MKRIDTCGMACPQPVLMTKKSIGGQVSEIEVLVDNQTAKTNVTRFLVHEGYQVKAETQGDIICLKAVK